jgi:hypothetical protein
VARNGKTPHARSTTSEEAILARQDGGAMRAFRHGLVLALVVMLACGQVPSPALSQTGAAPAGSSQLDKLVAPIALYPDPLVAQILPASTYPVEVVEAARAVANGGRPDKTTASQWDPSIQALVSYPTVLKMMSDRISWTTQLGQAVAANQSAVMAAIQQVRRQAQAAGNLQSNDKQVVSVQGTGDTSTIIIQPANPQVIYVPQYNPVAILSPPPPYYFANPGYGLLTFGAGFAAGAATAYACNWGYYGGYSSVTVNNYYHYNPYNHYAAYHPNSGVYTGYNAKTGTYGAYNPATGKYGTYNPSTGAYNKNGQTGTWHPPSSDDVGRSAGDYGASQYRASGGYGSGDRAAGSQYRGSDPSRGFGGGSLGDTGRLGGSALGGQSLGDRGFGGGWNAGGGGWGGDRGFSSGGFGGGGFGDDTFRGLGGGGWASRDASDRGFGSFGGGGGFGRFGGGGFGGFRGGGFGGFRGRR